MLTDIFKKNGLENVSPVWLAFFRFNIALFALTHFISIQPDFDALYSFHGYVYPDILNAVYDHHTFTFLSLQGALAQVHIGISYTGLLALCRVAYPLFLVMLAVGCCTRLSAVMSLLLQLLFIKSIHLYEYGVDYYTTIAIFYCCVFPVGKVNSIDNRLFGKRHAIANTRLYLSLLQAHLCISYFFSGFDKVIGESWRSGEALWKSVHAHTYYNIFSLDFLAHTPFFFIGSWATIILEMLYCMFINIEYTRKLWLLLIVLLHVFIALFLGLFFFSYLMIILNLAAFYAPYNMEGDWFKKKVVNA